ncbi:MAG: hypothetical protein KTR31_34400 [Myxococcales bacterium]|nr:hypothetical protein [Myxococcales bacterium]
MTFTSIDDPLAGERSVQIVPTPAPLVQHPWVKTRFVTGRTVSDRALAAEQTHRMGLATLAAQALDPGIVHGLQATATQVSEGAVAVQVASGYGLVATGEDVVVSSAVTLDGMALPVSHQNALDGSWAPDEHPDLASVLANATPVQAGGPLVFVLVAGPAYVDDLGALGEPTDPCERDPDAEPFSDWRYVDGAALTWMPLAQWVSPAEALGIFVFPEDVSPLQWWSRVIAGETLPSELVRNRLAHELFELERRNTKRPSWEREGVALGLAAFDNAIAPPSLLFFDGPVVRRQGGRRVGGHQGIGNTRGRQPMWQARVDQMQEQLAALALTTTSDLATFLDWLPPCGVLPIELFDLAARTTQALPSTWGINMAPVPIDQVEVPYREAISLAPFNMQEGPNSGDEIKVLVPVAPEHWDPGLLQTAAVAEDFWTALRSAESRVRLHQWSIAEVQGKIDALYRSIGGPEAVPDRETDDSDEGVTRTIASSVLWSNDPAMQEIAAAAAAGGFPDLLALNSFFSAMVGAGVGFGASLATAFEKVRKSWLEGSAGPEVVAIGADGPVMVAKGAASSFSGPGFELQGGWTHAVVAPDDPFPVTAQDTFVYVVVGEADTEAIDRAVAIAGTRPLVVLVDSLTDAAREELDWRYVRGESIPVVCQVPLDPVDDAWRVDHLRTLLTLKDTEPNELVSSELIRMVAATSQRVVFINVRLESTIIGPIADALQKELDVAKDPVLREQLTEAIRMHSALAAVELVDDVVRDDGSREPEIAAYAASVYDSIRQELQSFARGGSPNELLQGATAEPTFSTVPTSDQGLTSQLVLDLADRLSQLTSPSFGGTDVEVLTAEELDLLVGRAGAAGVGVGGFAELMDEKARRADDAIDFAFIRVQTAIFRLRQHMTGREKATRMASSPVLAQIADTIQADTSPTQLGLFFSQLATVDPIDPQGGPSTAPIDPTGGGGTGSGGTGGPIVVPDLDIGIGNPTTGGGRLDLSASGPTKYALVDLTEEKRFETLGGIDPEDPLVDWTTTADGTLTFGDWGGGEYDAPGVTVPPPTGDSGYRGGAGATGTGLAQASTGQAQAFSGSYNLLTPLYLSSSTASVSTTFSVNRVVEATNFVKSARPDDFVVRSTGIAQRVEESSSQELVREAYQLRASVTQLLLQLEILQIKRGDAAELRPLTFPLLLQLFDSKGDVIGSEIRWVGLTDPSTNGTFAEEILSGVHDPKSDDPDQAKVFSDAIRTLESVHGMLRVVETQVRLVREAVESARRARALIVRLIQQAEQHEQGLLESLDEARHDWMATRALLAEEQERMDEINARRAQVLAEAAPFVVFHRVREVDLADQMPVHDLVPEFDVDPVVEALRHPAPPTPQELDDAVELWRDAPARWLSRLDRYLDRINRRRPLLRVLQYTQQRATAQLLAPVQSVQNLAQLRGMAAVTGLTLTRQSRLYTHRQVAANLAVTGLGRLTWRQAQVQARQALSVGDLADSTDVPAFVSRWASQELDHIHVVLANLYREMSLVEPSLRARWVLRISQFDRPLPLDDLSVLPGWEQVGQGATARPDPFRKRELQALVDWLFGRISSDEEEARELMNDLVRIAILLASHAPVGRLIAGHVEAPAPVETGSRFAVAIDSRHVRVGMSALVLANGVVRARAVVDDLGENQVLARIVSATQPGVVLQTTDTVRFVDADDTLIPQGEAAVSAAEQPLVALVDPPALRGWFAR